MMILRFITQLKFWQIYAISLTVDLAIRLLRRFSDIQMLLTEPAGGWTLSELLPLLMWIGFEAGWAFVVAFVVHAYFSRFKQPAGEHGNPPGVLDTGKENSAPR